MLGPNLALVWALRTNLNLARVSAALWKSLSLAQVFRVVSVTSILRWLSKISLILPLLCCCWYRALFSVTSWAFCLSSLLVINKSSSLVGCIHCGFGGLCDLWNFRFQTLAKIVGHNMGPRRGYAVWGHWVAYWEIWQAVGSVLLMFTSAGKVSRKTAGVLGLNSEPRVGGVI